MLEVQKHKIKIIRSKTRSKINHKHQTKTKFSQPLTEFNGLTVRLCNVQETIMKYAYSCNWHVFEFLKKVLADWPLGFEAKTRNFKYAPKPPGMPGKY